MKTHHSILLSAAALLVFVAQAQAAVIVWGSASNISSHTDVSTTGTVVEAVNLRASTSVTNNVTVNGVLFTGSTTLLSSNAGGDSFWTAGNSWTGDDIPYDGLLSSLDFDSANQITITLGNGLLTIGQQYQIQVWFADDRGPSNSRVMNYASSSSDTAVALNDQFAIGTFTANATTQTLYINGGTVAAHLTAYQIRAISAISAIPEPSSALLIGLAGGLLLFRRQRP